MPRWPGILGVITSFCFFLALGFVGSYDTVDTVTLYILIRHHTKALSYPWRAPSYGTASKKKICVSANETRNALYEETILRNSKSVF